MTDNEQAWDATLAAARENVATGERLAAECEAAIQERKDWEAANGIDAEKRARFFAMLPAEQKRTVEEENERLEREIQDDLAALERQATPRKPGGKRRNYM